MLPWVELDKAMVPGGGELRLMRRGTEYSILAGNITLMNSRMSGSEKSLADLACDRLRGKRNVRLLIGGYGMGFTLRTTLAGLAPDARITVAELVPTILTWARGPMAELTGDSLGDPRVSLRQADVGEVMEAARASFDAILLDVDNGPDGLTRAENDGLYSLQGLHTARQALRPGGMLAVWSASPSPKFAARLSHAGFAVEEIKARAHNGKGARHIIWAATKA